jgi:hypothetical protein
MLKNGSFTEGWTDLPASGNLINQQPEGWTLRWIEPGQSLFGAGDTAGGVPECVHKLADQLPPNEQLGGSNALILTGDTTYKVFHASAPFGAELKQTVSGLKPGSQAILTVPVLAVLYGETDPFGAESGVWVNGEGKWVNGGRMGNREWFRHQVEFTVPDNGTAEVVIRVKSKWPRPKDFFIDGIRLEAVAGDTEPTDTKAEAGIPKPDDDMLRVSVPQGVQVITAAGNEPGVVVIVVPQGMNVELQ